MAYSQFLLIFLTSFNRFSMIFWINSYEKYWNLFFPLVVLMVVLVPIPFTFKILTSLTFYLYTESLDCYVVTSAVDRTIVYNELLIFLAITTILTAIINVASFYRLSFMTYKISLAERNLLFVSGSLFIVQLLADLNTTVNRLAVNDNNKDMVWSRIATTLLPYVSDGLTLIHPWMFLAFSAKARRCFMLMFIPGCSTTIHSNNSQLTKRRSQVATTKF
uniref:Serpentine receptor class gamma n=1 Tax=Caenorhabditis japonica TaxID=281687 RepID=A0A8R1HG94_CAEJA